MRTDFYLVSSFIRLHVYSVHRIIRGNISVHVREAPLNLGGRFMSAVQHNAFEF